MREIKFRNVKTKEKEPTICRADQFNKLGLSKTFQDQYASETSQNNIIWQQFTGLKDKNNKEIFDGDIIEWVTTTRDNHNRGVIVMREGCWGIEDRGFFKLYNQLYQIKVIGNIYKNPKLLNIKKMGANKK